MKIRSPFAWALVASLLVLLVALAPLLWQMLNPGAAPRARPGDLPAPWVIERSKTGVVSAFGLQVPGTTLADAMQRWGDDLQLAVIESRGLGPALEAYVERWIGGGIVGKLVLATDVAPEILARWRERSPRRQVIDAQAQRWALHRDDLALALRMPIVGLSFLPASRIDKALLSARFGAPAEDHFGDGSVHHWLYPDRGLAIAWDESSGKAVMQVVAVADFDRRLRVPLLAPAR